MHALRALVLLAPLLWSCAGPGLSSRHHEQEDAWRRSAPAPAASDDPFAGHAVLDRQASIAAVLARNPSIDAARWAWRAALARYPQETALEDPMLEYSIAPASVGASGVDTGQRVTLSQGLPFPGKLALRGEVALAEAEAAASDFAGVRLRLAVLASLLFDQAYLIERKLAVNDAHRSLLAELREIALARYEAGEASQQDPLEAELEEAELLHRDVALRADREITREQLNVLLHRSPELPLPPPPSPHPYRKRRRKSRPTRETAKSQTATERPSQNLDGAA